MKAIKLIKLMAICGLFAGSAQAATVTVSAGFGASGLMVTFANAPLATFHIAVGSWDGTTFTQFGPGIQDTGVANGSFTATAPAAVNSQVIHLFVGPGNSVNFDAPHVLFRTAAGTTFPSDVSSVLASSTASFTNFTTAVDVTGSLYEKVGDRTINFIPEPSTALLGLIGALGLLRRRR